MPIPFLLIGAAAATGIVGLAKGGEAAIKNKESKELIEDAQYIFDTKKIELDKQRSLTTVTYTIYKTVRSAGLSIIAAGDVLRQM